MNGYKINDNLYINCNNVDCVSFLNDKVKIHMNDNTSYYITPEQYKDIETKISQSGGSGGGADITANIKVTGNKGDIIGNTEKNKLCILNDTSSLDFKVVDKIEGGIEDINTLSELLPMSITYACCARYKTYTYIFGGYNSSGNITTIIKFNNITKEITTLETTLPNSVKYACCASYGDYIYIFDGTSKKIYKFDCVNETITTLSVTLSYKIENACCAKYGNFIYIFGGGYYDTNAGQQGYNVIHRFNCLNDTITYISTRLPTSLYKACCSAYDNYIYIFGGQFKNSNFNSIYKFDCANETITTLSTTLPNAIYTSCCEIYNNNIYIFSNKTSKDIYKFNCNDETIETITTILPYTLSYACCSIFTDKIYIFGGSSNGYLNSILDFSITFNLDLNNVLIYNANSNYSFDLITDQVIIPIKNVYIGDSNNTAQLAKAYLYDETQANWVNVNTGEVLTE